MPKRKRKPKSGATKDSLARQRRNKGAAPPPRTAHYDKKSKKQISRAVKIDESATEVSYRWTEDGGGDKIQVKEKKYVKDQHKARLEYGVDSATGEDSWVSACGNHCKINKDKFDPNYDEIFGKKKRGASSGKFRKFKKKYQ